MAAFADNFDCGCCNPYKIAKRLGKLLLSIWMICDMISDGFTTKKYYNIAQVSSLDPIQKSVNLHVLTLVSKIYKI